MNKKIYDICIFVLLAIILVVFIPNALAQNTVAESNSNIKTIEKTDILESHLSEFQNDIKNQQLNSEEKIKGLTETIAQQQEEMKILKFQLNTLLEKPLTNGTTFEIWSGILLGCVAVIVTVLGVGIALLSFIGYRELIEKGTESASLIAAEQTKIQFNRFIEQGKLDAVIAEGINRIAYRGIGSSRDEILDNSNGETEHTSEQGE